MLLNTFHGRQDHTSANIYKLYNRIMTKKFSSATSDSGCCGAVNAIMVKNVKDANIPLVNCFRYAENKSLFYQDLRVRKTFIYILYIFNAF